MSTLMKPALSFRGAMASMPVVVWVPLLGAAWVFLNVLLVSLGTHDQHHPSLLFCVVAGGIDGGVVSGIALATLSEKLHAGTAGLLSGYGFQDVLDNFKVTRQAAQWLHAQMDPILGAILGPQNEVLHEAIQRQVVAIAGITAMVVLATLVIQLVRAASNKSQTPA